MVKVVARKQVEVFSILRIDQNFHILNQIHADLIIRDYMQVELSVKGMFEKYESNFENPIHP